MPSDRLFGAYMFMFGIIMLAALAAISVATIHSLGWAGLAIVIPALMVTLPLAAFLLWDTAHAAWHNNVLWDKYPENNKH